MIYFTFIICMHIMHMHPDIMIVMIVMIVIILIHYLLFHDKSICICLPEDFPTYSYIPPTYQ